MTDKMSFFNSFCEKKGAINIFFCGKLILFRMKKKEEKKTEQSLKNKVQGKQYFNKFEKLLNKLFRQLPKRRKGQPFSNKTVSKRILSAALCILIDAF